MTVELQCHRLSYAWLDAHSAHIRRAMSSHNDWATFRKRPDRGTLFDICLKQLALIPDIDPLPGS